MTTVVGQNELLVQPMTLTRASALPAHVSAPSLPICVSENVSFVCADVRGKRCRLKENIQALLTNVLITGLAKYGVGLGLYYM